MSVLRSERRPGAYYDSIVLMQLQSALAAEPGVSAAGVVMATEANLALLESTGLRPAGAATVPDDLLVAVRADTEAAGDDALARLDSLLDRRRASAADASAGHEEDYRPRSLETAVRMLPEASWVLISVPGRYAAGVAKRALDLDRNVFLYSDNVDLDDEVALKRRARSLGLTVMGPDCGTAIVGGVGLGFANRVRRGGVGLIGASGTGLQAITSGIHTLGAGVSHALGTGGRDLKQEVGAVTALQGLDLLARDSRTEVIVLVSKPPAASVATRLLGAALETGKPVVVDFIGYPPPGRQLGNLHFATGLGDAARLAVDLLDSSTEGRKAPAESSGARGLLRGLFAGGTLAFEALQGLRAFLPGVYSNVAIEGVEPLDDPTRSRGHTILDLGEDEFTIGRLHPMMDQTLRLARLRQETADPEVSTILLDVVLGHGSHTDPAAELAPVIEEILERRKRLEIVVIVVGTEEDPQDLEAQTERLSQAGARVFSDTSEAVAHALRRHQAASEELPRVDPAALAAPLAAINVGLESFHASLLAQEARAVQVDWRPPAGGDRKLMAILDKMRGTDTDWMRRESTP
ncbi:MAG: acyl-CoA synthetase FdrA [bacterium]|nr:acyl-CoA synthetase FdrA [bacterium]